MTRDICVSAMPYSSHQTVQRIARVKESNRGMERYEPTRSRFILSIALSIPFTTCPILFVTCRIVTAVSTRDATASILDASRRRFKPSVFFRIAFWAYMRAPSLFPFCNAAFNLFFSAASSLFAFFAWRLSVLAVN